MSAIPQDAKEAALQKFLQANPSAILDDVLHTALVHSADFQSWRRGERFMYSSNVQVESKLSSPDKPR